MIGVLRIWRSSIAMLSCYESSESSLLVLGPYYIGPLCEQCSFLRALGHLEWPWFIFTQLDSQAKISKNMNTLTKQGREDRTNWFELCFRLTISKIYNLGSGAHMTHRWCWFIMCLLSPSDFQWILIRGLPTHQGSAHATSTQCFHDHDETVQKKLSIGVICQSFAQHWLSSLYQK